MGGPYRVGVEESVCTTVYDVPHGSTRGGREVNLKNRFLDFKKTQGKCVPRLWVLF